MSDLFREVDEELRNEKAVAAFTRWQPYILGVGVLIVAASAGYRYYEGQQAQARETAGAQFEAAAGLAHAAGADPQKAKAAEAALEQIAKSGPPGYKALALLHDAALVASHDKAAGVRDFDALAGNPALEPLMQDVARLRAATLRLDDADQAEMSNRLLSLAGDNQPFRATARELLALSAIGHNDLAGAGTWLDKIIVDPKSPDSARARAEELSGIVRSGPLPGTVPNTAAAK